MIRKDKKPSSILNIKLNKAKNMRRIQAIYTKNKYNVTLAIYMRV
jgi:hypothetical protein